MKENAAYRPVNKIRIVTAASLFDGHDASINVMRRLIQASGAEVIHLGHDRSVAEIVDCAIQEDANAVAVTCYQGGHMEFFRYMRDLLVERGGGHVRIFGGGGGTILPVEIEELQRYGITRIYHPDDGRAMGLQGMIDDLLSKCDFPLGRELVDEVKELTPRRPRAIARLISAAESHADLHGAALAEVRRAADASRTPVLGVTGTGGAGKSSLVDELVRRFLRDFEDRTVALVSVDPSKRKTGGALLGDRIRMNAIQSDRVFMRSLATRQSNAAISAHLRDAVDVVRAAGFDLVIVETSGIGQGDTEIVEHADVSLYVMTPDYGAATQLEKIDMLDFADVVALNKSDKRGAADALRDVRKQYRRSRAAFDGDDESLPIFGTVAPQFNDPGMNQLYRAVMERLASATGAPLVPARQATLA
ncbi:MAG: cobalamin-dependent protein, partial [Anaeromyxobacteraceae bacterium]